MKKLAFAFCALAALGLSVAEAAITVTSVKQRWPFSGKVDVDFTLEASEPQDILFEFSYAGQRAPQKHVRGLDATVYGATNGVNHFVFDPAAYGLSDIALPNLTFTPVWATNVSDRLYAVLDGPTATCEFLSDTPANGWTQDVYKTSKTPFRRVVAGTYQLGNTDGELKAVLNATKLTDAQKASMGKRFVTLSSDYYIALFPMTSAQETYLRGGTPTTISTTSYQNTYAYFRGNTNGTDAAADINWPYTGIGEVAPNSWVDKVNKRFGITLDLPTDAQLEVAIRAGTTTIFFNGGDESWTYDALKELWLEFSCPQSPGKENVGLRKPNQWNIYNPQGMNYYWCLDAVSTTKVGWVDVATPDPQGLDPVGDKVPTGSLLQRVVHGNGYSNCGPAGYRRSVPPIGDGFKNVLRPVLHLADPRER